MNNLLRRLIIEAAYHAKHGHVPSALSIVEIICALEKTMSLKDIFILSKGHGCLAYYAYLTYKNYITVEELNAFGKNKSKLGGHPDKNKLPWVYTSTGSLGHGAPTAVGTSLAKKLTQKEGNTYCIIGDGECNEGTIWESALVAEKHKLNNLCFIIDNNKSQVRSLPVLNLTKKFQSFDWFVIEVDGHDINGISDGIKQCNKQDAPSAIIANTIKGKGIKVIEENMFAWHHRAPTEAEYQQFIKEINEN